MDTLTAIQNLAGMNDFALRIFRNPSKLDDFKYSSDDFEVPPGFPVTAKLVEFRGQQVAAFDIGNKEMICLPQVYELFLKNMVGGLHTVYTKLRRLDINPLICNVEQVRALRSLGAIQPGVNRCKLIESTDFDKLYEDCTSTCTRPGRPSKRGCGGYDDLWMEIAESSSCSTSGSASNSSVFNQLLPQFTTQQLIMQHFVALSQQQQQQREQNKEEEDGNFEGPVDGGGTPLNLSKSGSGSGNSENNDSDSMENMRKEDSSPNNSMSDRDRAGSNSNSMSVEGSSSNRGDTNLMNKILSLIEITSEQFKHERQELWRERNEIQLLRESFHKIVQEERDLRVKLENQTRKCGSYERRFKYMQQQLLLARGELRRNRKKSRKNEKAEGDNQEPCE
ncbi:unnamed protein product [Caenorhabditis angaria]|uniref:SKI/SNO/DAC domain-containing protein n=1 Tax=Caenorhabditis angaria TaxID=860376 RepID=A0A9P1N1X3_9PELO|nr:unnamed protein product [Caenorhabditis angaria]